MTDFEISYVRHLVQNLKYDRLKQVLYWDGLENVFTPEIVDSEDMVDQFCFWLPYFTMEFF